MITTYKIYESKSKREELKELLALCTDAQQLLFRRMYSPTNKDIDINELVDKLKYKTVKHGIFQVNNTLEKTAKKYNL